MSIKARELQLILKYKEWRNFEGVVMRAENLIIHQHLNGTIIKTKKKVKIGSGAVRDVDDYEIDGHAEKIITELASSYKLNNSFKIRNETVVIQLIEQYCNAREIPFIFQYPYKNYVYDCMVNNSILIEFDEPFHDWNRQKKIDNKKDNVANISGLKILRIKLDQNIIDVICYLEDNIFNLNK